MLILSVRTLLLAFWGTCQVGCCTWCAPNFYFPNRNHNVVSFDSCERAKWMLVNIRASHSLLLSFYSRSARSLLPVDPRGYARWRSQAVAAGSSVTPSSVLGGLLFSKVFWEHRFPRRSDDQRDCLAASAAFLWVSWLLALAFSLLCSQKPHQLFRGCFVMLIFG